MRFKYTKVSLLISLHNRHAYNKEQENISQNLLDPLQLNYLPLSLSASCLLDGDEVILKFCKAMSHIIYILSVSYLYLIPSLYLHVTMSKDDQEVYIQT